jgi:hypothetical protein
MDSDTVKRFFVLIIIVFMGWNVIAQAQATDQLHGDTGYYTVKGYRHGKSVFKRVEYAETKPLRAGELDFKHYHLYDEIMYFLEKWAEEYPDIIDLYSAGESYEGRSIPQITLTNKKTGRDTDKPAMVIDAGIHGMEMITTEAALYQLHYMLERYGKDKEITDLVDSTALYFRILNDPDSSEILLNTGLWSRSSVRPYDDDGDGLLDEDPDDDLDGDGHITLMRKYVGQNRGDYIIDPRDSRSRLLTLVGNGKGDHILFYEGIDNDGDGRYNEDKIGGIDLNRNFLRSLPEVFSTSYWDNMISLCETLDGKGVPDSWIPEREALTSGGGEPPRRALPSGFVLFDTGSFDGTFPVNPLPYNYMRDHYSHGRGAFPLSEPEERCFTHFLLTHRNISIVNGMHSEGPHHGHVDLTGAPPEDRALFEHFDREGIAITGYAEQESFNRLYSMAKQRQQGQYRPPRTDTTAPEPDVRPDMELVGQGSQFGYWIYGVIWYVDELWARSGAVRDYNGDGVFDSYDGLRWNDEECGGKYFVDWKPFDHPQLGEVEIGSFKCPFIEQNPPPEFIEEWAHKEAMFNIFLAKQLPRIEISSVEVTPAADPGVYTVAVQYTNTGFLPTAIERAKEVNIVRPDRVSLEFDSPKAEIISPKGRNTFIERGWAKQGEVKTARFQVKLNGIDTAACTVHVQSSRGGHNVTEVRIGGK